MADIIILDIETQHLADEVGGWHNLAALQVAVAVTWDERHEYRTWWEGQAADLVQELNRHDLIVGYNISHFDLGVLSLYGDVEPLKEKTFDILDEIRAQGHQLVALNVVAQLNLGEAKAYASGADAVKLWRDGRLDDLEAYCLKDVELTQRLYEMWEAEGVLWVSNIDFVIWPGPVAGEERRENGDDTGIAPGSRRADLARHKQRHLEHRQRR